MMDNLDTVRDELFKIENEEGILEKEIDNIYFYKLIRGKLLFEIILKLNLSKSSHDTISFYQITKIFLKNFFISLFKRGEKEVETIFIDESHPVNIDATYKSTYFFEIMKKYDEENIKYEVIYPWVTKERNKKAAKISMQLFFLTSVSIIKFKILNKFKLKKNKIDYISKIEEKVKNEFKVEINLYPLIKKELDKFKINYKYYLKYFLKKKVKKIYLICSYGKEGIIAAAQDLNIEVIELQHGVINKYHIGYSFKNKEVPYFPDKLLVFGEYWKNLDFFPLNTKIKIYGFPYLNRNIKKYEKIIKKENQVIFISQGPIGDILSKIAVSFALENKNMKVIYRLHPGEFLRWKKEYKELYQNRELENLEISYDNSKEIYEYLYESNYLIGVSSTLIYEALSIGLKVGILELYSHEFFNDLIEKKIVYLFKKGENIDLKKLENLKKIDSNYFFSKNLNII